MLGGHIFWSVGGVQIHLQRWAFSQSDIQATAKTFWVGKVNVGTLALDAKTYIS